ncbi:MAG: ATP-binding protein [Desulfobacteraceae bacterium]|jgi:K+-sensing histidine kinase KdpD|nr:ATP-binding protein [Desulfobacteraceae bacterium]
MQLGDELVKEQIFFRKELRERVSWFIQLRWVAAGAALTGSWLVYYQWRTLPITALNLIIFFVIIYNIVFHLIWRRLEAREHRQTRSYTIFAHTQIICDFIALYLLIYYTGSIYSPLLTFLIFHIILAGILLSPLSCYLYCLSVLAVLGGLMALQALKIFPLQPAVFHSPLWFYRLEFPEILAPLAIFVVALFIAAFLVTSLKLSLRIKGRELLRVSKELDAGNAKLTALYKMVTEIGNCSELQTLMDAATQNAAQIMGVKACSIKLLDDQREKLIFASTYGLSENYVKAKEGIEVAQSPINRKIIEGSLSAIGKIDERDYFQYPEDIRKEGIASMICLPLAVEKMVLGVFCVYSTESYCLSDEDTKFFSLMADLTALAIENLKRDLDKSWFLQKAAHQLRSPLNTVVSMLNLIRNLRYGPLTEKQEKTINRSVKRLQILGDVVSDLLKLDLRRSDLTKTVLHPVAPEEILKSLMEPYRILAAEKKVAVAFDLEEPLPRILADEQLVDELFTNLISNGVKYTPPGGKVRVKLSRENGDRVRFQVSDTGIGIPADDIPHLFTEFFRSASAKQFVEEGTGLGLVVVKEILDRLRGTVSVKSTPGEGSIFTCRLPTIQNMSTDTEFPGR